MKTLLIGGTGIISTEITRALLEAGHDVVLFNRGWSETPFAGRVRQLAGDRNDGAAFAAQIGKAAPFDCVIDMICFTPQQAEASIRACKGRAGHFIFCSTVDVYAKPASAYPVTESEPCDPLSTYGRQKVECEKLFRAAHDDGAFPLTVIRPAHTYSDRGTLVHTLGFRTSFLDRIRRGRPVLLHGDGTALWAAARAEDVGPAFAAAAGNPKTFGKTYHVTAEENLTWGQYYQKISDALGTPLPELVHTPATILFKVSPERCRTTHESFQHCHIFDNSAARNELGFRYTIPFAEGARATVRWLADHNKIEPWQDDPEYDAVLAACRHPTA